MNRMKEKITMKEQAWAFILDYFWAPVVTAIVALWAAIHKVDKKVGKQTSDRKTLTVTQTHGRLTLSGREAGNCKRAYR